jgi:hypothetical protein
VLWKLGKKLVQTGVKTTIFVVEKRVDEYWIKSVKLVSCSQAAGWIVADGSVWWIINHTI